MGGQRPLPGSLNWGVCVCVGGGVGEGHHLLTHFQRLRSVSVSQIGAECCQKDEQKEQTESSSVCHLASVYHATPKCMTNAGRERGSGAERGLKKEKCNRQKKGKSGSYQRTESAGGGESADGVSWG